MLIKSLITHIKIHKIIKAVVKNENLLENLSNVFSTNNLKVNFKMDWIGRIYAVLNPVAADPSGRIFEYDTSGTNIKSFVHKWIMDRMIAVDRLVKNHELFDIVTYDIQQIDSDYNFLVTFTPISWDDLKKHLKISGYIMGSLLLASLILILIFVV